MEGGALLHVGCGGASLPDWAARYTETRLDIDEQHKPDIVASMVDMGDIGPFDAVFSCHSLEHLPPHGVAKALSEFHRVLKTGGAAIVFVPDLEDVTATERVLFDAPCGPITGLDLMYGLRSELERNPHMAHRTGFVCETLRQAFEVAGFAKIEVRRLTDFNLMAVGVK
jgi:ubiquinone/menaquinone biosynthesis C-methylase UbiE